MTNDAIVYELTREETGALLRQLADEYIKTAGADCPICHESLANTLVYEIDEGLFYLHPACADVTAIARAAKAKGVITRADITRACFAAFEPEPAA